MKKILFILAFLPFVSIGDLVPDNMLFNIWPYLYSRGGSNPAILTPSSYETSYSPITASALDSYFFNNRFAVLLNPDFSLAYPNIYPSGTLTNSSKNSTFNLQALDGSGWYCPVRICPSIQSYASVSARLFFYGYLGPGIDTVGTNRNGLISFNVNPSILFSEVLYGTNYLFRQTLVNHLSTISSSVQNIELNVSGLQTSIDEGNSLLEDLNSSSSFLASNSVSAVFVLSNVVSNTAASAFSLSQVSSNTAASVSALSDISGNTSASASALSNVSSNTAASVSALSDISGNTSASASALSDISGNSSSMASDLGSIKSDTYYLHGDVQELVKQGRINSYTAAALSGSGLPSPDNPFFPYDPDNPYDPNHPSNPNSPWNPNSPNSLSGGGAQGAFTTNNVVKPITNSVRQASAQIQSNAVQNADRMIDNANQNFQDFMSYATGDGEGFNVRIKFPLYEVDSATHVNVRDTAVVGAINELHGLPVAVDDIGSQLRSLQEGGLKIDLPTNLLERLDDILVAITNRPSYLLLDHYAGYISNGVYSASIDIFEDEFPNVYSNLVKYGLGNDNFWSLFGANLLYQSGLVGTVLEDLALVRDFADTHIEGGFNEGIRKIVDLYPSSTQIEDFLNSVSNHVLSIDSSSSNLVTVLSSVTNSAVSAFKPFKDGLFDTLPTGDLVFFKLANEQYVTIPVHEQYQVWSLIRSGIAFALVAVNVLFFPRFVLLIVLLFSKLSNRFVKFVPTDKM